MFGHRSLYHDGWKANCPFPGPSFAEAAGQGRSFGMPLTADLLDELDVDVLRADGRELYWLAGTGVARTTLDWRRVVQELTDPGTNRNITAVRALAARLAA